MRLKPLTLDHKPLFDRYNLQSNLFLSSYAFVTQFIWKDFFDLFYRIDRTREDIDKPDCHEFMSIYAKQGDDYFLPILPIPCRVNCPDYIKTVCDAYQFAIKSNKNPQIARIENVPTEYLNVFIEKGFQFTKKETEYLYETWDLCNLKGNRYKKQRNAYNALLTKYNSIRYEPYQSSDKDACFELYDRWRKNRVEKYDDTIYQAMLHDSKSAQKIGITQAQELGLVGRIVKINGELRAYTFGYELNSETFCILFEISDLNIKGLSQYIFREFCKELSNSYRWINSMSDSGLENLKRVKLSYHPKQIISSYNIYEHNTHLP